MQNFDKHKLSFSDPVRLANHLVNHVLTPDESHAWYVVWDENDLLLAPSQSGLDQCFRLREKLRNINSIPSEEASILDDQLGKRYEATIVESLQQSERLGWKVKNSWTQVGLSTKGVYYVVSLDRGKPNSIITGFIPGFGTSAGVRESQGFTEDPHIRTRANSRTRRQRNNESSNGHKSLQQRTADRRSKNWTIQERQYYLVFRPVIQFIRGFQNWDSKKAPGLADLKPNLPPMRKLSLQDWIALQQRTGDSYEFKRS